MRRHGSKDSLVILFLDGFNRLSTHYIAKLKELGIDPIDFSVEFSRLVEAFSPLERFGKFGDEIAPAPATASAIAV